MKQKQIEEIVVCKSRFGTTASFRNDVGGTSYVPPGRYKVKVVLSFRDYETGDIIHADVIGMDGIARLRKAGTTGFAKGGNKAFLSPPRVYLNAYDHKALGRKLLG